MEESYWDFLWQPQEPAVVPGEARRASGDRDIFVHAIEVTAQVRARREVERLLAESERARAEGAQAELAGLVGRLEKLSGKREKLEGEGGVLAELEERLDDIDATCAREDGIVLQRTSVGCDMKRGVALSASDGQRLDTRT